ncbi:MAG: manganese efflux pump MntP family protein [Bacteroidales bacterium]|nr:manganese efflux pump MntP family protein [Bacteroidales bacterium]
MSLLELILLAIGLAMDCFAVSFSAGAVQKDLRKSSILILAFSFGFFQAAMPVLGWFGGELVVSYMSQIDHWIAFGILGFIGGKMLYDGLRPGKEEKLDVTKVGTILILSIATSIDALAVGFTFSMLQDVNIWFSVAIIGIASFVLSMGGVELGKKISRFFKPSYAQILGGGILIFIGLKILLEHLLN